MTNPEIDALKEDKAGLAENLIRAEARIVELNKELSDALWSNVSLCKEINNKDEQISLRDEAMTRLEAEFDATCNAEELRQVREDNKRLTIQRDHALDDLKAEIANHREDSAALEAMRETAKEANRVHIEMHNQITALQAEVARLTEEHRVCGYLVADLKRQATEAALRWAALRQGGMAPADFLRVGLAALLGGEGK